MMKILTAFIVIFGTIFPSQSFRSHFSKTTSFSLNYAVKKQSIYTGEYVIDGKSITDGSLVEYTSAKGSKRLAIVCKRSGAQLEVLNDAKKSFSVPISRVTYHINGSFAFGDLLRLNEILGDLKPIQVERLWESSFGQKSLECNLRYVSKQIFGSTDPVRLYASIKLMSTFGSVFFEQGIPGDKKEGGDIDRNELDVKEVIYIPLTPNIVQINLRNRAALKEFKMRFMKVMTSQSKKGGRGDNNGPYIPVLMPEMPDRVQDVVGDYSEGLKQIVVRSHPWVVAGWSRRNFDAKTAAKGREFLEYLDLAPNCKNAKKVLELTGIWPAHTNIEKYIMGLRDKFPLDVLDEANYLLDNADVIPDPDERLRRDLRHIGCYAIDREGAAEVDDALSIELLEDGREKLWIHIADVSRWIRPGSALSLEAEHRMVSVYMPDERISMFPSTLSTELLSLGAGVDSYALSCGVTLNADGEVTSYEVCPSKIRVTKRLSYTQLDDLLARAEASKDDSARGELSSGDIGDNSTNSNKNDSTFRTYEPSTMNNDLIRLNHWAVMRHDYRKRNNALDQYLRHKTELSLSVRTDQKSLKYVVSGYTTWSNATSMSMVSEYMILMCQTIGGMCEGIKAPVWYKLQSPSPPLEKTDLDLQEGETPFLRSARIMRHLRAANDSREPGIHCTSGSSAYVQCTSPIRRYHDLYNHYRLKATMHGASMGSEWVTASRAEEEAGISRLDGMATAEERLQTLTAVRLVTRHREQYWLRMYVNKLVATVPVLSFDCLVVGPSKGRKDSIYGDRDDDDSDRTDVSTDSMYDALILQLGSFHRYKLYSPHPKSIGELLPCNLYKRYSEPISYLLLPSDLDMNELPASIAIELKKPKKTRDPGDENEETEGDDNDDTTEAENEYDLANNTSEKPESL